MASIGPWQTLPFLEPTPDLTAVLRELTPEKAGEGPLFRADLEEVHVDHEAQHAQEGGRPGEKD